jgi:hypothetical protein
MPAKVLRQRNGKAEPKIIECEQCSKPLELDTMTNQCTCGTFYNGFGQRLAPPSQWGYETGEHFGDDGQYLYREGGEDD